LETESVRRAHLGDVFWIRTWHDASSDQCMAADLYPRKECDGGGWWYEGGDDGEGVFHGAHAWSSARRAHSCLSERKSVLRADALVRPASQ
jgi:hypothetical protein